MAVVVGPYQRIVGFYWPTEPGPELIYVTVRLLFYGDRYETECYPATFPPEIGLTIRAFTTEFTLRPSKYYADFGGVVSVSGIGAPLESISISGMPSLAEIIPVTGDGYGTAAEMQNSFYSDLDVMESDGYHRVIGTSTVTPLAGAPDFTNGLALDWVWTYPTRIAGPYCGEGLIPGSAVITAQIDVNGTLPPSMGGLDHRTEYARTTLDFSGLTISYGGESWTAYAASIVDPETADSTQATFVCQKVTP